MQRTLETRPAVAADEHYVWSVYKAAVRPLVEPHLSSGWDDAKERQRFLGIYNPSETHIINLDGHPIGWLSGRDEGKTVTLEHLYVEDKCRGCGYGGKVFEGLLAGWKAAGKTVHVSVMKNVRVKGFLTKRGFSVVSDDQLTETLRSL